MFGKGCRLAKKRRWVLGFSGKTGPVYGSGQAGVEENQLSSNVAMKKSPDVAGWKCDCGGYFR